MPRTRPLAPRAAGPRGARHPVNPTRATKTWLLRLGRLAVVIVVAWGLWRAVSSGAAALAEEGWRPGRLSWPWLLVAVVAYALGQLPQGLFWRRVMWRLGQRPALGAALRAFYIGHLGKYVLGKALVVLLRAGFVRGPATNVFVAGAAVFHETLTTMAVGSCLAGVILLGWFRDHWTFVALAAALIVASGLPTIPAVFARLARLAGIGRQDPQVAERLAHVGPATLAVGWATIAVGWLLMGTSLWAVLVADGHAAWPIVFDEWLLCQAATALAVVLGFISLIPGGAGVRELVFLELLRPRFGDAGALVAAVLVRLVWLVTELGVAAIVYPFGPRVAGDQATSSSSTAQPEARAAAEAEFTRESP